MAFERMILLSIVVVTLLAFVASAELLERSEPDDDVFNRMMVMKRYPARSSVSQWHRVGSAKPSGQAVRYQEGKQPLAGPTVQRIKLLTLSQNSQQQDE